MSAGRARAFKDKEGGCERGKTKSGQREQMTE